LSRSCDPDKKGTETSKKKGVRYQQGGVGVAIPIRRELKPVNNSPVLAAIFVGVAIPIRRELKLSSLLNSS